MPSATQRPLVGPYKLLLKRGEGGRHPEKESESAASPRQVAPACWKLSTLWAEIIHTVVEFQPQQAWFTNIGKRLTKSPKLFLVDTGLLTSLLGADADRLRSQRTLLGHVVENFVALELTKQLGWSKARCRLFHFRSESGREVDLVLEDPAGRLVGVEIKSGQTLEKRDFRGLRTLHEIAGERFVRGVVLYTGEAAVPFGKNMHALPLHELWA